MRPTVSAVMLAYGAEPWLESAVTAALASTGVDLEVIVVDNGCTSDAVSRIKALPRVRVLTPAGNTGYTGGCALATAESTGEFLVFINSDALVAPDAVTELVAAAAEPAVGIATGSIRLADRPGLMNTAGNPLHYTGLVWAGGYGEPASRHQRRGPVACASGCCFAIRRSLWTELGGFPVEFFMYHEDTELSLRLWQRGYRVEYIPGAVVLHHYEFSRNPVKNYLLERNRLALLLTAYRARTLLLLLPMLLLTEAAMVTTALAGGWLPEKLRGYRWLWRQRHWLRERRARVQAERTVPDRDIAAIMTDRFDPTNVAAPPGVAVFNLIGRYYWRLVRPFM